MADAALHPAFGLLPVAPRAGVPLPTLDELNALAARCPEPPASAGGAAIRFVPALNPASALDYETGILGTGEVPTRANNAHDVFNALCWITFPRFKRACNAMHVGAARPGSPHPRGAARDALTLLDESGLIVLCADPELERLLRGRLWKDVFWERRERARGALRFLVCGHALYEKLLAPYPGITAKALFVRVAQSLLEGPDAALLAHADAASAALIAAGVAPSGLPPLPLAGIPGWHPANEDGAFYDDASIFRPARPAMVAGSAATVAQSASAPAVRNSASEP